MDLSLLVIAAGSFLAAFVNAAFATGGIYILLAASLAVFPVTAAIALQGPFSLLSLVARIGLFWSQISWGFVGYFILGCLVGVAIGAVAFAYAADATLLLFLGCLILALVWIPIAPRLTLPPKGFAIVGVVHSIFGTLFGIGGILQPLLLRTPMLKGQITGTLAVAMLSLDVMKIFSYSQIGFDYRPYLPHILVAALTALFGSWAGKHLSTRISEMVFRRVFRWLVTVLAARLIFEGAQALVA